MLEVSNIKDINLASEGQLKIDWVKQYMPVLSSLDKEF